MRWPPATLSRLGRRQRRWPIRYDSSMRVKGRGARSWAGTFRRDRVALAKRSTICTRETLRPRSEIVCRLSPRRLAVNPQKVSCSSISASFPSMLQAKGPCAGEVVARSVLEMEKDWLPLRPRALSTRARSPTGPGVRSPRQTTPRLRCTPSRI